MTDFGFGDIVEGRCSKCDKPMEAGDFPFCPHGKGTSAVSRDDIPGGMVIENGFPTPQTFYSMTEMNRAFAAAGLQRKETFCPTPGTDIDPQGIPNPKGYMDPQTLENGRILLSRNGAVAETPDTSTEGVLVNMRAVSMSENLANMVTRRVERGPYVRRSE